jgi:hypothetical protein
LNRSHEQSFTRLLRHYADAQSCTCLLQRNCCLKYSPHQAQLAAKQPPCQPQHFRSAACVRRNTACFVRADRPVAMALRTQAAFLTQHACDTSHSAFRAKPRQCAECTSRPRPGFLRSPPLRAGSTSICLRTSVCEHYVFDERCCERRPAPLCGRRATQLAASSRRSGGRALLKSALHRLDIILDMNSDA